MKNDFDFIKDKIDNSGVNAPEEMNEAYVARLIDDVQPAQPQLIEVKRKLSARRVTALAASFVLVAGIATGIAVHLTRKAAVPDVDKGTGLIQFSNYDQVRSAIKEVSDRKETLYSAGVRYSGYDEEVVTQDSAAEASNDANGAASSSSSAGGSDVKSHSETYLQVEGVDEADTVKTDGRYIYAVTNSFDPVDYSAYSYISVFPAKPGTKEPTAKIIPGETSATPDEATPSEEESKLAFDRQSYRDIREIFLRGDRLIVITDESLWKDGSYARYLYMTGVYTYDISDPEHAVLLDSFNQSGGYRSSRMIGDTMYLITADSGMDDIPLCGRSTDDETPTIPADCIYSVEEPSSSTFLIVSSYDTLDYTAETQSKAILGVAEQVYCNENNMYITATEYNYDYWVFSEANDDGAVITYGEDAAAADSIAVADPDYEQKTKIFKVSLTGGIAFTAYGEVEGYIDSRYSMDEYNGNLRVATTGTNKDYEDVNNLFVLNGNLDQIGAVTGFAETESIKAVRYVGDTAYVITYEQTDPLFVIDLSSPTSPEILGSVKISGFSTMLVPVDSNTILGLGYDTADVDYTDMEVTDGFKLALFDVSDPANPKVLDSRSYVNYTSQVMYEPRSLVYNPDRDDYIVPVNYYYYDGDDEYTYEYDTWSYEEWDNYYNSHTEQYGGALNFRVEGGRIVETGLYRSSADSVDRCLYVGDTIYMTYINDYSDTLLDSVSYK